MILGGGGSGYVLDGHLTRVAAAPMAGSSFEHYEVVADYGRQLGTAGTLDQAVAAARELSTGSAGPIAVMPGADSFALFSAEVRQVDPDSPRFTKLDLEASPITAAFAGPSIAAIVDGRTAVTQLSRDLTPVASQFRPIGLVWRQTGSNPFTSWKLDASMDEIGFGHAALDDAVAAAKAHSIGDQPAVAITSSKGRFHLHPLTETSTGSKPQPFHVPADFASRTYSDATFMQRDFTAIVDGDVVLGTSRPKHKTIAFGPLETR